MKATPFPTARPEQIVEAYQRSVLPVVVQAHGREVLHASAVLTEKGVITFCADSGTGKSTLAYGLSTKSYVPWADDALAFDVDSSGARAIRLPFQMRFRPPARGLFRSAGIEGGNLPKEDEETDSTLAAVCLLGREEPVEGATIDACRIRSAPAFAAVLRHAYCFGLENGERKREMMSAYLKLITRVPIIKVRFRRGPRR